MLHYRILVRGKVQGVWYRRSAVEKARELDLSGYAQNLPDGSVVIEAEGTECDLQEFIAWCHTGPPLAKVDSVECFASEWSGYEGFAVRH